MNGLEEAMKELQLKKGLILAFNQKDKMVKNDLEWIFCQLWIGCYVINY